MIKFISNKKGIDTSDATATEDDIALNMSAYARGEKMMGKLIKPEPIYATDDKYSIKSFTSPSTVTQLYRMENFFVYKYGNNWYLGKIENGGCKELTSIGSYDNANICRILGVSDTHVYILFQYFVSGSAPNYIVVKPYNLNSGFEDEHKIYYPSGSNNPADCIPLSNGCMVIPSILSTYPSFMYTLDFEKYTFSKSIKIYRKLY